VATGKLKLAIIEGHKYTGTVQVSTKLESYRTNFWQTSHNISARKSYRTV